MYVIMFQDNVYTMYQPPAKKGRLYRGKVLCRLGIFLMIREYSEPNTLRLPKSRVRGTGVS